MGSSLFVGISVPRTAGRARETLVSHWGSMLVGNHPQNHPQNYPQELPRVPNPCLNCLLVSLTASAGLAKRVGPGFDSRRLEPGPQPIFASRIALVEMHGVFRTDLVGVISSAQPRMSAGREFASGSRFPKVMGYVPKLNRSNGPFVDTLFTLTCKDTSYR